MSDVRGLFGHVTDIITNLCQKYNITEWDPAPKCSVVDSDNKKYFLLASIIPSVLVAVLLSFQKKRLSYKPKALYGRPGVPWPINFLEQQEDRMSFLIAFGLLSWTIWDVLLGNFIIHTENGSHTSKVVAHLASSLLAAVVCYPIFALLSSKSLTGYILGSLYIWVYSGFQIKFNLACFQTSSDSKIYYFITFLPRLLCIIYLCIFLPYKAVKCFLKVKLKNEDKIVSDIRYDYVKQLFKSHKKVARFVDFTTKHFVDFSNGFKQHCTNFSPTRLSFLDKLKHKFYPSNPHFRYSLTILVAVLIPIEFLFVATLNFVKVYQVLIRLVTKLLHWQFLQKIENENGEFVLQKNMNVWIATIEVPLYFSLALAFILTTLSMLLTLKYHRRNLLSRYKGNGQLSSMSLRLNPTKLIACSCRYIGFQFGYSVWGFAIQALVLMLISLPLSVTTLLVFYFGYYDILYWILEVFGPIIAYIYGLFILEQILVYIFFLQKDKWGKRVLALDNRQWFFNFQYFTAFANATVSLVTCFKRMIISAIFGIFFLPRLDVSIMSRQFEKFDKGHLAYVSLLQLESIHTNPTMHTFINLLHRSQVEPLEPTMKNAKLTKLVRNRWNLFVTLHNNPALRLYRCKQNRSSNANLMKLNTDTAHMFDVVKHELLGIDD